MENKKPIVLKIRSKGYFKNMFKIIEQLKKANRPIMIDNGFTPSLGVIIQQFKK